MSLLSKPTNGSFTLPRLLAVGAALALTVGLAACAPAAGTTDDAAGAAAGDANAETVSFAKDDATLVFGVVPDTVDTQTNYQPLMDYIAEITGKEVEYHESTDYAALIEAAVAGKIDVASFSGFTYVTATNNGAKITPFASIITQEGEEPGYYSEAIVPEGSSITSIDGFKGKKVCFVDPSSTSGYLFPSYNLLEAGIDPEKDVTPVFAGKHDVSALKTSEGVECEAGFAEDSVAENQAGVKIIAKTKVPGAPMVVSDSLPAELKTTIVEGLSNITITDIQDAGIKNADSEGFINTFYALAPVDDEYYDLIRDICEATNAKQCQ
ncbi:phosphate/phosphite/phosphonate ABC transporter substrate-binding protein [Leifsonia sp. Root4]|uniref:phosphate/phosphite/phosphonate ABC transporter substrate-binding protein n=1 Tax=Leifsonia sp. Root4 TaxID=1736525 RepID=UPI0009EB9995|nr:phosphate/phosphite/phosphonate ABC transporter substrate-binding protein [Leifsonia sp. Root4]